MLEPIQDQIVGTDKKLLVAKILFPYMYTTKDKHEEKKEK